MEEDKKLYKEYLNGNEEAFNKIVNKYKTNLIYFISTYVWMWQKIFFKIA